MKRHDKIIHNAIQDILRDGKTIERLEARVRVLEAGINAIAYLDPERATIQEAIEIAAPLVNHP